MHERERWKLFGDEGNHVQRDIPKLNSYISGRIDLSDISALRMTSYFQSGWDQVPGVWRNRVSADITLDISLSTQLGFKFGYSMSYEDRPIIPISKLVYQVTNGLKYSF